MASVSYLENHVMMLIDGERTSAGLPTYVRDAGLDNGARAHTDLVMTKAMASAAPQNAVCPAQVNVAVETWTESWQEDHWCPTDEPSPIQRIQPNWQTLYNVAPGENVGRGWAWVSPPDPTWDPYEGLIDSIHAGFMAEGPGGGHYMAILNTDYNSAGVGVRIFDRTVSVDGGPRQEAFLWFTVDFAKL